MRKKQGDGSDAGGTLAMPSDRLGRITVGPGLTIRMLGIFVTVAKLGSMSAAGERLALSQPAISQTISALEAALGIQLFDRSFRPPALTLQGATMLRHAQAVVDSIEKFESALRLGPTAQLPSLRIGMLNSFAGSMGPFVIERLRDIAAELTVDSGFRAARIRAVTDRDFDFIVTADQSPPPSDIQMMPILTEPFVIVAPASYTGDMRLLGPLSTALDLIRFDRDPYMSARIDAALQDWGVAPRRRFHVNTSDAVLQMVEAGGGWTILPPLALYRALVRGDAIRVANCPQQQLTRVIKVVFRKGEGGHVAGQLHSAALAAVHAHFLPKIRTAMPELIDFITVHT